MVFDYWLAGIVTAGLLGYDDAKADLLATIVDEAERLNRFIVNMLDMTKLESGAIRPNTVLQDVNEIVGTALQRASKILSQHRLEKRSSNMF
jgi:two-component system sensor histidine kinase KdpD